MLGAIVTILKIIPVSVVIAIWFSGIVILGQLVRDHPEDNVPTLRFLSLIYPTVSKIIILLAYLIVGLFWTFIAGILLTIFL